MTPKELADKESRVIFEDDKVLFIEVDGDDAIDYYGNELIVFFLNRDYTHRDDKYFVIGKDGETSYVIVNPEKGDPEIFDFKTRIYDLTDIRKDFPQLNEYLLDIFGITNTVSLLTAIELGQEFDSWFVRRIDGLIGEIQYNKKRPGDSKIIIKFDDRSDYFDTFGFNTEEKYYIDAVTSHGGYYDNLFYDEWRDNEDWNEGHILLDFNDENKALIDSIVVTAFPQFYNWRDNEKVRMNLSEILLSHFNRQIDNMKSEYSSIIEESAKENLLNELKTDYCNPYTDYKIFVRKDYCFYQYFTYVQELKELMIKLKVDRTLELFESLGGNNGSLRREPYEYGGIGVLDIDEFNSVVTSYLEDIIEKIETSPEEYPESPEENKKIIEIFKKFPLNQVHKLSGDRGTFMIKNMQKGKVILYHTDKDKNVTPKSFTPEEFNNFLNVGELFENLVRILKTIV